MEIPEHCNNFMELKQVIKFNVNDIENGDKFYFQCKKCGEVKRICRFF